MAGETLAIIFVLIILLCFSAAGFIYYKKRRALVTHKELARKRKLNVQRSESQDVFTLDRKLPLPPLGDHDILPNPDDSKNFTSVTSVTSEGPVRASMLTDMEMGLQLDDDFGAEIKPHKGRKLIHERATSATPALFA